MGKYIFKLPDLGEGVVEAEIIAWHVQAGQNISEGDLMAEVMTDKATVEIPAPVEGKVTSIFGKAGEMIAVGTEIASFDVEGDGNAADDDSHAGHDQSPAKMEGPAKTASAPETKATAPAVSNTEKTKAEPEPVDPLEHTARTAMSVATSHGNRTPGAAPLASPAVRGRAKSLGIDLAYVPSSGEAGKITHADLDAFIASGGKIAAGATPAATAYAQRSGVEEIKVIGLRRKIAEKMQEAKRHIPHITYVDEVDVTAVEKLRQHLNANRRDDQPKLTFLPFLMRAMVKALTRYPQHNALYDDDAGVVYRHADINIGIATQTDGGLTVPVVHHAEALDVWGTMAALLKVSNAARDGSATRDTLTGSTITITSLGRLGGIVTTPVINRPEVAIIGVNNMIDRPVVIDGQITVRKMMNLSSSFDHRIIDGYDAAELIQYIKTLLEHPASIFID